jgi:hypothetical protein
VSDETMTGAATSVEDELRGLLDRARQGDRDALPALREALDRRPGVWRAYGDLAAIARDAWIGLASGTDLALRESLARQVAAIEAEAAGPSPAPLESLLAGRVAACWLQACYADAAATQAVDASIGQADFARKRQDSAHRRYLSAIAALAMVRKLLARAAGPPSLPPPLTGPGDPIPDLKVAVPGVEE